MPVGHKLAHRTGAPSRTCALLGGMLAVVLAVQSCEMPAPAGTGTSPSVARVVVTPDAATGVVGLSVQLTATPEDASGNPLSGRAVAWATDNAGVATVDGNGLVTGQAVGSATISATSEGRSGTASITITSVPVASLEVTPPTVSVNEGKTVQLTATPKDANGNPLTGRPVSWSSSNTAVATVSGSGLVTGKVAGTATITATSEGQSGSAGVTVAAVPVASVAVTPATATVNEGKTVQLTATPKDASGNPLSGRAVTWASSNLTVATVSGSGLVTGQVAGTATITATSEGQTGSAGVTVTPPPPPGTIVHTLLAAGNDAVNQRVYTTASISPAPNALITVAVLGRDATGGSPSPTLSGGGMTTWTEVTNVTFDAIATPTRRLTVYRAMSATPGSGPLTITFLNSQGNAQWIVSQWEGVETSGVNGEGAIGQVASSQGDAVSGLTVALAAFTNPNNVAYGAFGVTSNAAAVTPAAGFTEISQQPSGESTSGDLQAEWATNLTPIAATWTSLNAGAVGIELRAGNSGPPVPVASVTVTPAQASVDVGQTVQLTATPRDASGNPLARAVTWTSSNTNVAMVSASGLVTGAAAGTATMTATSEGQSGTAAITVTTPPPPAPVASVTVAPATANVDEGKTLQLTATLRDANGNVLTGRTVTWATSNATVATVSGSGLVTGKVAGTATVTATSEGQSGSAAITVVHVPVASVTVSPAAPSVQEGSAVQLTATLKDANGNVLTGRAVTWASGNTAVATVNGSGLVTGVVPGSATVTATSEGQSGTSAVTVTPKPPPGSGVVFVGAGDISDCGNDNDEATAKLLDGIAGTVYTLGDNVYSSGTATQFAQCYDPTWGRHKARTHPVPGNHDYNTSGATGYYGYFGAAAGDPTKGYYSYDLGDWHVVALNSEISVSAGSAQEQWLRADLAASTKTCTLAYWHKPRFSSGTHGSSTTYTALWQALYDNNADVVLAGHDHNYQRFAPQTPAGVADPVRGIREFVVGTGGESHYNFTTPIANTEAYNNDTFGVLKLTLYADHYDWEFVPVAGKTYTDTGSASCH